jgi:hypothetical protein
MIEPMKSQEYARYSALILSSDLNIIFYVLNCYKFYVRF